MDIKERIREFVLNELVEYGSNEIINDDDSLMDSGVLDSLSILQLISFLDEKFEITLCDDEIYPENFESINLIYTFIKNKLTNKLTDSKEGMN